MMINNNYYRQVELLLEVLPLLNQHPYFALKGGTAINLFVQEMPRLSVDIDLCYLPIEPREVTLNAIAQALIRLGVEIRKECQADVTPLYIDRGKQLAKLLVTKSNVEVKIEPNLVIRGSVFDSKKQTLCKAAQEP